jgi:hypothetical protein
MFLAGVIALVIARYMFTAGQGPIVIYAPHDDWLYVLRAYHLLTDGTLGPYDARTLVKLPGISFFLAGNRLLAIPYQLTMFLLYAGAGLYFVLALKRCGVGAWALLAGYTLYLFNPVTLDTGWYRVLREPLSICVLMLMLGAMTYILQARREGRGAGPHVAVLSGAFGLGLLVREDDVLLYAPMVCFGAILLWEQRRRPGGFWAAGALSTVLAVVSPFAAAKAVDFAMRTYVERSYGLPLLQDFSEGEFPRLIAAMRSVNAKKDNRHVMISQEALQKIRNAVPELAPIIDRLPPPHPTSESCVRFGICSEWTNSHFPFWLKEIAAAVHQPTSLLDSEAYLARLADAVEAACSDGRLECHGNVRGLLPRFELRWTRAAWTEAIAAVQMMILPSVDTSANTTSADSLKPGQASIFSLILAQPIRARSLRGADSVPDLPAHVTNAGLIAILRIIASIMAIAAMVFGAFAVISGQRGPLNWLWLVIAIFASTRLLALTYVSIFMGRLDPRLYFGMHVLLVMCGAIALSSLLGRRIRGRLGHSSVPNEPRAKAC